MRILLVSTPVGPLGSGIGGGVELTLHSLVLGLTGRGHDVEVVAPAGSLLVGRRTHQIPGTLQPSSQHAGATSPSNCRRTRCSRRCGRSPACTRATST